MPTQFELQSLFAELADAYEQRGQPLFRDRFLVLAADACHAVGDVHGAERHYQHLVVSNPHHLLSCHGTFEQALRSPNVATYLNDLRRNYPIDVAQGLLQALHVQQPPIAQPIPMTAPLTVAPDGDLLMEDEPTRPTPPKPVSTMRKPSRSEPPVYRVLDVDLPGHAKPRRRPTEDMPAPSAGGWVNILLTMLLCAGAIALAGFTFVVPLLR